MLYNNSMKQLFYILKLYRPYVEKTYGDEITFCDEGESWVGVYLTQDQKEELEKIDIFPV